MAFHEIGYDVADGVATITLDRPERLNAFTDTMQRELVEAFDRVDASVEVRALVVTGSGRAFCNGADLSSGPSVFDPDVDGRRQTDGRHRDEGGLVALRAFDCTKPVIAAINGPAIGVGITMTLPFDVRMASTAARFGFVFTRRGLVPEACSSWFLPRIVGIGQALEWCYSGRVFGADEARRAGLVRSVHEPDELLPAAYELAHTFAAETSPVSVTLTRALLWRMLGEAHPIAAHRATRRWWTCSVGQPTCRRVCRASWRSARPASRRRCRVTSRRATRGGTIPSSDRDPRHEAEPGARPSAPFRRARAGGRARSRCAPVSSGGPRRHARSAGGRRRW